MKTAIVILNWNGKKLLEQFLPSIIKYNTNNSTIYVADNASTDNSVEYIKIAFPEIKIIRNNENGGYAKGYNDALKHIQADIYCLINSDIQVTQNWLTPVINIFKEEEKTAIIQPKILDFKNKLYFEYAGAAGGFIDLFGYPYCRGRIFNTLEKDNGQYNDTESIFWASGACFFIRSNVFKNLGGFDEDFFAHQEEIDLCWRAQNLGYNIKYTSKSEVYHVGGATLSETNPKKTYLNFRNSLLTLTKNTPAKLLFFVIFSRLILDGIAGIKFIFELKPLHAFSIIKAHFSFYSKFLLFLKKRNKKSNYKKHYKYKSIVWQYYALGNKKYTDLNK